MKKRYALICEPPARFDMETTVYNRSRWLWVLRLQRHIILKSDPLLATARWTIKEATDG